MKPRSRELTFQLLREFAGARWDYYYSNLSSGFLFEEVLLEALEKKEVELLKLVLDGHFPRLNPLLEKYLLCL